MLTINRMKLSFLPIIRKGKKRNRAKKLSKFMSCSLSKKKLYDVKKKIKKPSNIGIKVLP